MPHTGRVQHDDYSCCCARTLLEDAQVKISQSSSFFICRYILIYIQSNTTKGFTCSNAASYYTNQRSAAYGYIHINYRCALRTRTTFIRLSQNLAAVITPPSLKLVDGRVHSTTRAAACHTRGNGEACKDSNIKPLKMHQTPRTQSSRKR